MTPAVCSAPLLYFPRGPRFFISSTAPPGKSLKPFILFAFWRCWAFVVALGSVGAERGLLSLQHSNLVAPWHVGSWSSDQRSNPHPLYWKTDSLPLDHQGSPPGSVFQKLHVTLTCIHSWELWLGSKEDLVERLAHNILIHMKSVYNKHQQTSKKMNFQSTERKYWLKVIIWEDTRRWQSIPRCKLTLR